MFSETIELRGHIIDSLILPKVLDQILTRGATFKITEIKIGQNRADQLKAGQPAWVSATGTVVRGYVSKIDGSVQPYGLVVRRDDPDFRLAVDRALVGIYKSGEIDAVYVKWLAPLGRPGPLLNAMFYLNALPD